MVVIVFVLVAVVVVVVVKGKGKAVPLQARCGSEGSRRFRLPDFMIFGARRW